MKKRFFSFLFYFLSFTWGLAFTLIGCLSALFLALKGHKAHRYGPCFCFELGSEYWGGCNLGIFFLAQKNSGADLKSHELGHAIQNCIFGPFMIFLIALPSLIRSRYRVYLVEKKGVRYTDLPDYYSIWFEAQATKLGEKTMSFWENNKQ